MKRVFRKRDGEIVITNEDIEPVYDGRQNVFEKKNCVFKYYDRGSRNEGEPYETLTTYRKYQRTADIYGKKKIMCKYNHGLLKGFELEVDSLIAERGFYILVEAIEEINDFGCGYVSDNFLKKWRLDKYKEILLKNPYVKDYIGTKCIFNRTRRLIAK